MFDEKFYQDIIDYMVVNNSDEYKKILTEAINRIDVSETGGSVSCEAHRPDIYELKKEYEEKFTLLINETKQPYRIMKIGQSSETLWQWIETKILKVR